jgi:hypothetical protein
MGAHTRVGVCEAARVKVEGCFSRQSECIVIALTQLNSTLRLLPFDNLFPLCFVDGVALSLSQIQMLILTIYYGL